MKKLVILLFLSACTSTNITCGIPQQQINFEVKCYSKPYINKRDDVDLCLASSIAEYRNQAIAVNSVLNENKD